MRANTADMASYSRYGLILIQGDDATSYLNAQLTRRVDNLAGGETGLASWCNAKGRALALFRITHAKEGYALSLPARMIPLILPRLKLFVLRSKVQIDQGPAMSVNHHDTRPAEILAGIPEIYPETTEQFLPQMLNLDQLGAIDFKKGCYPGQEIVARSQYLGQLKRRMYLFSSDTDELPVAGMSLSAGDDAKGTVVDAAREENGRVLILAVIPIEAAGRAWRRADGGSSLKLLSLPYTLE